MAYEGHDAMYTGKPSKPGKTQIQIGYGLVEGEDDGFEDTANTKGTGKVTNGLVDGKRRVSKNEQQESG